MTMTSNAPKHSDVVEEVAELCRARGLSRLAGRAEDVLDRDRPRWMLVAGADDLLDTWAAESVREIAGGDLEEIGLEDLASDPDRSVAAERLVVLLECGRLLGAEAMEDLAAAVEGRPEGTFAVVYRDRGELGDPEDLKLFERGVRRWALEEGQGGDLSSHGVYLSGDSEGPGFLRDRLEEDRRGFLRWLETSPGAGDALERWRALRLLESTEAALQELPRTEAPEADARGGAQEARAARELVRGRKLLASRIDADLEMLERGLVNDLGRVVSQTTAELRSMLAREGPSVTSDAGKERLRRLVEQKLHASGETWSREAAGRIEAAEGRMLQDLGSLFSVVDWELVDRVVPPEEGRSRERLLKLVDGRIVKELSPALTGEVFQGPDGWDEGVAGSRRPVGLAAAVAAASAGVLLALNVSFPWTLLVSGSAAAGTGWLDMTRVRTRATRTAAADVERALERQVESAESAIRDAVRRLRPILVEPLEEEVAALEAVLLGAEAKPGAPEEIPSMSIARDLETLRELRRRTAAMEGS